MNQKQNTRSEVVLLAAGGTGGHLFPASALARRMKEKGHEVHLATDARGLAYLPQLEEMPVHKLAAATIFGGKIWLLPWNLLKIIFAFVQAVHLVLKLKPSIVVGFGGYPSFAPALAAQVLGRQVLIHEQNAVLGAGQSRAVWSRRASGNQFWRHARYIKIDKNKNPQSRQSCAQ